MYSSGYLTFSQYVTVKPRNTIDRKIGKGTPLKQILTICFSGYSEKYNFTETAGVSYSEKYGHLW